MPVMAKIGDLLQLEEGEVVPAVKAVMKAVFKQGTWRNGGKSGTVQSGFLSATDSGDEIKFKAWNHDDLSEMKGEVVVILAKSGPKGLSGLKMSTDKDKYGNEVQCVEIGKQAEIQVDDGPAKNMRESYREQDQEDDDELPGMEPVRKPKAPEPERSPTQRNARGDVTWMSVGADIKRVTALYTACFIEVVWHAIPAIANNASVVVDDPAVVHAAATTVMIAVLKDKDKLWSVPPYPWKGYHGTPPQPQADPPPEAGPDEGDGDNLP